MDKIKEIYFIFISVYDIYRSGKVRRPAASWSRSPRFLPLATGHDESEPECGYGMCHMCHPLHNRRMCGCPAVPLSISQQKLVYLVVRVVAGSRLCTQLTQPVMPTRRGQVVRAQNASEWPLILLGLSYYTHAHLMWK